MTQSTCSAITILSCDAATSFNSKTTGTMTVSKLANGATDTLSLAWLENISGATAVCPITYSITVGSGAGLSVSGNTLTLDSSYSGDNTIDETLTYTI